MLNTRFARLPIALVLILFVLPVITYAQKVNLKGVIKEATGTKKEIIGASVILFRNSDSLIVKTTISDKEGKFELANIAAGNYRLTVTVIGFIPYVRDSIQVDSAAGPEMLLNEIGLTESTSKQLKEVIVAAKKPLLEYRPDKITMNVEASITSVGSNALEVLEKSPGVSVDKDGNISLRGKQNVTVMIDGKPTQLAGGDLAKLLSSIGGNQLSQVEIMANPSSKYDAAGNAGVINIKTKKNTAYGFNSVLNLGFGQARYWRVNNSLDINYRNKNINAFLNYGFNARAGFQQLDVHRRFLDDASGKVNAFSDLPTYQIYHRTANSLKLGLDYTISPKTSIGFVASGQIAPVTADTKSYAYFRNTAAVLDSTTYSHGATGYDLKNGAVNLNMQHHFDSLRTLTTDLDYLEYTWTNDQLFNNISTDASGNMTSQDALKGLLPVTIRIYGGKADYTQTFKDNLKMESGVKISQVNTDNMANYWRQYEGGAFNPDYGISNHFLYKENINAAYLNLSKEIKKWDVQLGLRFENTNYKANQLGNPEKPDTIFTRHYNNLFPTASLGYKINGDNEMSISFGRRIDRPAYQTLNPFVFYINKYTYESGNPLLLPQYTNNISLSYLYKNKFTATLNYSQTSNYFTSIFSTENKVTTYLQENLSTLRTGGLSLNQQWDVGKWWNGSINANVIYKEVKGFVNGTNLQSDAYSAQFSTNNRFTINKGLSAELSAFYNSRDADGQFTTKGYGQVSAGIAQQLFDNKGSIKVNVRDIFYSQVIYGTVLYNNVIEKYSQGADTRSVSFTFTYRFGRKFTPNKKRANSIEQEQGRAGG